MIDIIQNRYAVVHELKDLVYNKDFMRFVNERDHIQQIIENHYWLFGDQYQLVTADVSMRKSLQEFEKIAIGSEKPSDVKDAEWHKRMDIFLYASRMTDYEEQEGLIIELKAPTVSLTPAVFSQIEAYANIVRREPRFSGQKRRWKFFAICSSIDDDVKAKLDGYKVHGKAGLAGITGNFEIYALTWDDIFISFESRYRFLLEKMKNDYEESVDSSDASNASRVIVREKVQRLIDLQV